MGRQSASAIAALAVLAVAAGVQMPRFTEEVLHVATDEPRIPAAEPVAGISIPAVEDPGAGLSQPSPTGSPFVPMAATNVEVGAADAADEDKPTSADEDAVTDATTTSPPSASSSPPPSPPPSAVPLSTSTRAAPRQNKEGNAAKEDADEPREANRADEADEEKRTTKEDTDEAKAITSTQEDNEDAAAAVTAVVPVPPVPPAGKATSTRNRTRAAAVPQPELPELRNADGSPEALNPTDVGESQGANGSVVDVRGTKAAGAAEVVPVKALNPTDVGESQGADGSVVDVRGARAAGAGALMPAQAQSSDNDVQAANATWAVNVTETEQARGTSDAQAQGSGSDVPAANATWVVNITETEEGRNGSLAPAREAREQGEKAESGNASNARTSNVESTGSTVAGVAAPSSGAHTAVTTAVPEVPSNAVTAPVVNASGSGGAIDAGGAQQAVEQRELQGSADEIAYGRVNASMLVAVQSAAAAAQLTNEAAAAAAAFREAKSRAAAYAREAEAAVEVLKAQSSESSKASEAAVASVGARRWAEWDHSPLKAVSAASLAQLRGDDGGEPTEAANLTANAQLAEASAVRAQIAAENASRAVEGYHKAETDALAAAAAGLRAARAIEENINRTINLSYTAALDLERPIRFAERLLSESTTSTTDSSQLTAAVEVSMDVPAEATGKPSKDKDEVAPWRSGKVAALAAMVVLLLGCAAFLVNRGPRAA